VPIQPGALVGEEEAAAPEPPVADAGPNQNVDEGDPVTLDGSGSTDADGTIVGYLWTQIAGPTVSLSTPTSVSAGFTAPDVNEPTTMTFRLQVTDDDDLTDTDDVNIFVADITPAPAPPVLPRSARQLI
jgi:hypothetical protein